MSDPDPPVTFLPLQGNPAPIGMSRLATDFIALQLVADDDGNVLATEADDPIAWE